MLDIYHPSVMGSKVMVRTLPDIKGMQLNLRDSPHREISQAQFDSLAENKKARLVQVIRRESEKENDFLTCSLVLRIQCS